MAAKRRVLIVFAAIAMVAGVPTPAAGIPLIQGFTWYADGGTARSGPPRTTIAAFATEARPNHPFKLVTAPASPYGCQQDLVQDVNPTVRYSSSSGFIGLTSGPINRPVGEYHVCFFGEPGSYPTATYPLLFTVV